MYFGLLIDAALIGIIVAAMERDEFPGWGAMIAVVLAMGAANISARYYILEDAWPLGLIASALVGGLLIAWLCEMSLRRAALAAGIYLGVRFVIQAFWQLLA